eukprot:c7980_g1_i3.p2 GENE.c7980_g1_i3~~c7980_g1_i3.p2  ORF type:complete len:120 (+),score=20.75 c7980_g1_i3:477-836(+)
MKAHVTSRRLLEAVFAKSQRNRISDEGAIYIAAGVESGRCSLHGLDLSGNDVSEVLRYLIPQAVKQSRTLRSVVCQYGTSQSVTLNELEALLSLSSHYRWTDAVQVITPFMTSRISASE